MPPISAVEVEEAITLAEQREDEVREASALLDEGLTYFIDTFVLPEDPAKCPSEYGRQLSAQHRAYLQQVREEIRLQSHNLRNFHARPRPRLGGENHLGLGNLDDLDAMSKVVTLMAAAFVHVHNELEAINALSPLDRTFIEQTLPGIILTLEASNTDVKKLQDKLQAFKQTFYLLASEEEVATCVARLLATQITADGFAESAMEPFQKLFRLAQKREQIIKKADKIAVSQNVAWLKLPSKRVPRFVYLKELERYEPLLDAIEGQKQVHDKYAGVLTMLHHRANGWPETVVGPNGKEIALVSIRRAMQEYEWITETSYQLIEAALPINATLKAYTTELQKFLTDMANSGIV